MSEEKKENPLKSLLDFYNKSVEEGNKKGFGDLYKEATKTIFKEIKKEYLSQKDYWFNKDKNLPEKLHITDVEYSDGYFIFGRGDNTVISFKIKEVPGWLFGIWWSEPTKEENWKEYEDGTKEYLRIKYEWFAQYEENIDKFKPSHSTYGSTCDVTYRKTFICSAYGIVKDIMFMIKEPELAFCRDYCSWDYNEEYHTRAEAKRKYLKYRKDKDAEKEQTPILNQRMIDTLKELFKDEFDKGVAYISDSGEGWSPRYELVLNKDKIEELKDIETGCYSLEDFDDKNIAKTFDKVEKECDKVSDKYNFWWSNPVSRFCFCVENKRFNKSLKLQMKEKGE